MAAVNADQAEADLDSGVYDNALDDGQKVRIRERNQLVREDWESELTGIHR